MKRSYVSVIVAIGLIACAATRAEPTTARSPGAGEEGSTDEPSSHSATGHDSTGSNASERASGPAAQRSNEPAAPGDGVEISNFCSEHGITANLSVERCVSTPLGTRPDAQLWCSRREELDDNRVAYYVGLYRAQGKRLAKVIELPYAAGPKPLEERPDDVTYYIKLFPDVAADAKSFDMREESGFVCDDIVKRLRDEFSTNPDLQNNLEQLVARICAARGKYNSGGQRQK
jgi:hypothetical protein